MQGYLAGILAVSAVTALLGLLPSDERIRKTVSFALSLAVLSAIVLPLPKLLRELPSDYSSLLERLDGEAAAGEDYLKGETLSAVGAGIAAYLSEEIGLPRSEITVLPEGDIVGDTLILRRVTLVLGRRAAAADVPRMVRAVEENTGAECEVRYLEE